MTVPASVVLERQTDHYSPPFGLVQAHPGGARDGLQHTPPQVIHLVGRITEVVFGFLGPATNALAAAGASQTLIVVDDPALRHHLGRIESSVRRILVRADAGLLSRVAAARSELRQCLREMPNAVVHLHGIVPSMLGAYATRVQHQAAGPLYFSPHGSKSLGSLRPLGAALMWAMRPLSGPRSQRAIVSLGSDASRLRRLTREPIELIESPIAPAFFEVARRPALQPLVLTDGRGRGQRHAGLIAQLAIVLGEEVPVPGFAWVGPASAEVRAPLAAAGVQVREPADEAARAGSLAEGWIFVGQTQAPGFPQALAEAMAVGLPCVARDTPAHRDLIIDGETGYLCDSDPQVFERVVRLLEAPELRSAFGKAARREARRRFDPGHFRDSLLAAYGVDTGAGDL